MIVKNEAGSLGHCLESIRGLWDDLVILDTGSTDGTRELARSFGARVELFDWVDDFAAARNRGLAFCTGDWILVLDADEAVAGADHAALRGACEAARVEAFRMPIRNYLRSGAFVGMDGPARRNEGACGEGAAHSHYYLQRAIRLFRAQGVPVYRGKVHELVEPYFEDHGLPVADLAVAIHHFGKLDMGRDRAKQAGYFRLALAEARARPGELQLQYNVIQEGLLVEAWAEVVQAAEVFRVSAPSAPMLVWLGGGLALQGLGRHPEAMAWFDSILQQQPGHAAALGARAESLWKLGRIPEAQADYLRAMEADPGYTLPFLKLAALLEEAQDGPSARSVLEAGLDQNPRDATLWEALVGLAAKLRDPRVAQDALDALRAVPDGGKTIWHQLVIHALRAADDEAGARVILELGLAAFPGDGELLALVPRA